MPHRRRHLRRPRRAWALAGLGLTAAGTVALAAGAGLAWVWAYLLAVNAATALVYAWDRSAARRGGARVPEIVLHGMALVGGTPAAAVARRLLRHKTVKPAFRIAFWAVAGVQAAAVVAWALLRRG